MHPACVPASSACLPVPEACFMIRNIFFSNGVYFGLKKTFPFSNIDLTHAACTPQVSCYKRQYVKVNPHNPLICRFTVENKLDEMLIAYV